MKIIIITLLMSTTVLCQDDSNYHQQHYQQILHRQPTLQPAAPRLEPIQRTGYSITHGDAKSTVNINLHPGSVNPNFHQPESFQLGAADVSPGGLQYYAPQQQEYYQGQEGAAQYAAPKQTFLTDLATKQYLSINPNNAKTELISQDQPQQQSYNVGYSINIANNAPKLRYRVPMPKNAHSYRQQKLLNADIITGIHKGAVEKPNDFTQTTHEYAASNIQPSANYIQVDQGKGQYAPNFSDKQTLTKVYADVKNTHGYTWKSLSPGVEISGYHSLDDMSHKQQAQAHSFDHAGALGKSQGFDISNVVESGKTQYQPQSHDTQAHNINKGLSESSLDTQPAINYGYDASAINSASSSISGGYNSPSSASSSEYSHGLDTSGTEDLKFENPIQNSYHQGDFSSQYKSGELNFNNDQSSYLSSGSKIEFDKSLLDGFYKNYNPLFYAPEVTLPSPNIPKDMHITLHGAASQQLPQYNFNYQAPSHFKNSVSSPLKSDPQLQMINQHYAYVQASAAENQHQGHNLPPLNSDVKPVTEQQEDSHVQQTQIELQKISAQPVAISNPPSYNPPKQSPQNFNPSNYNSDIKEQKTKGNTEHKKYMSQINPPPAPSPMRYGRPVAYINDKNFRMKTNLRPPPMIIIHKNY